MNKYTTFFKKQKTVIEYLNGNKKTILETNYFRKKETSFPEKPVIKDYDDDDPYKGQPPYGCS